MKKFILSIFVIVLVTVLVCSLPHFINLPGTTYKGREVPLLVKDTPKFIEDIVLNDTVVLHNGSVSTSLKLKDIATADVAVVKPKFFDWLDGLPLQVKVAYKLDKSRLQDALAELSAMPTDARIVFDNNQYKLVPETPGFYIDDFDSFTEYLSDNLDNVDLDVSSFCTKAKVTSESLENAYNKVSWLNTFSVVYSNGSKFDINNLMPYIPTEYDCTKAVMYLDNDFLENVDTSEFVESLCDDYSTKDTKLTFNTTNKGTIDVDYGTFGTELDVDAETLFLDKTISTHSSAKRDVPALKGYDEFKDTYVEVSIDEQHLWLYDKGSLLLDCDVVTGTKGVHDTPTGVYYMSECINGKYLVGPGYRTWVNKWMRLTNNGIGLHDATWRRAFGKNIYKGNGSHGCINMPKDEAYKLFDFSYVGLPVVIY